MTNASCQAMALAPIAIIDHPEKTKSECAHLANGCHITVTEDAKGENWSARICCQPITHK